MRYDPPIHPSEITPESDDEADLLAKLVSDNLLVAEWVRHGTAIEAATVPATGGTPMGHTILPAPQISLGPEFAAALAAALSTALVEHQAAITAAATTAATNAASLVTAEVAAQVLKETK